MSLFNRIFGGLREHVDDPKIKFGRYTDAHKSAIQLEAWEDALTLFDQDKYTDALTKTLDYLKEEEEDNISYQTIEKGMTFEIRQGSKCIEGRLQNGQIFAEAKVVKTNGYSIGYLRRLIESNYGLNYSRFALDPDQNLTIVFDSHISDTSPYKLYNAFKEMAVNADKQDDILLDEFSSLTPINQGHLNKLGDQEKEAKYNFLVEKVNAILTTIDELKLSPDKKPGAVSYLLLDLIYRLDYLISPEGKAMESFEKMHRDYYAKNGKSLGQKNAKLIIQFKELIARSKESFLDEFYEVSSTFGITNPVPHSKIIGVIDPEVNYINWYIQNRQPKVAEAVCGFIAGHALFSYAPPKPIHQLFHLYFSISESAYFNNLGFSKTLIDTSSGKVNKLEMERQLKDIEESNKENYPELKILPDLLNYNSFVHFSRSFILMMRQLNAVKKERDII